MTATIIYPDFSKKRGAKYGNASVSGAAQLGLANENLAALRLSAETESSVITLKDAAFIAANTDLIGRTFKVVVQRKDECRSIMRHDPNSHTLLSKRALTKTSTLEVLCKILREDSVSQWRTCPTAHMAILFEVEARLKKRGIMPPYPRVS